MKLADHFEMQINNIIKMLLAAKNQSRLNNGCQISLDMEMDAMCRHKKTFVKKNLTISDFKSALSFGFFFKLQCNN